MECPFCFEEIKNEAVVCRHCKRDFSPLKPLLNRIAMLEKELVEASSHLQTKVGTALPLSIPPVEYRRGRFWTLVVSFVLTYLGIEALVLELALADPLAFVIFISLPLAFGLLIGLFGGPTQWVVLLASSAITVTLFEAIRAISLNDKFFGHWFSFVLLPGVVLVLGSAVIAGRWLAHKRGREPRIAFVTPLARTLVRKNADKKEIELRVERLAKTLTALAPLLTFLASIIGTLLTYFATLAK